MVAVGMAQMDIFLLIVNYILILNTLINSSHYRRSITVRVYYKYYFEFRRRMP